MITNNTKILLALICLALASLLNSAQAQIRTASDPNSQKHWDEMMHYIAIGRWDLARGHGEALLLQNPDPQQLLDLAESPRYANSYRNLALLKADSNLADIADQVLKLIEQGRFLRRTDPLAIASEVKKLSGTTRARMLAVKRLADSGEWAVPLMIEALRDPTRAEEILNIRWALPQIGKNAVNPLVVVLQYCGDLKIRLIVLETLAKIGYSSALPVIAELAQSPQASSELKVAALAAIREIDPDQAERSTPAALLFEQLAQDYYNHIPSLQVPANQELANVWFWDDRDGLYLQAVPRDAFDELMTMRYCENTVRLDPTRSPAISMWLSAFFRLEAEGYSQPDYFGPDHADAATYALTAGPQYLHRVLARALDNHNRPVALATIHVLQRNAGQQSLLYQVESQRPLLRALTFADREVRFSAALTIAGVLPQKPFADSELVMSIISEALRQKGDYYALIIDPDMPRRSQLATELREIGLTEVIEGNSFPIAFEQAQRLPSIDLIILSSDLDLPDLSKAIDTIGKDYRLAFCPTIIVTDPQATPTVKRLTPDRSFVEIVLLGKPAADIMTRALDVMERNDAAPFAADKADRYASQAAQIILQLAVTANEVLDVTIALPALLEAGYESRTDIQQAAIATLARINVTDAQRKLAELCLDQRVDLPTRLLGLKALSYSAKAYGNLLLAEQISHIYAIVASRDEQLQLRNGAAEAYGALDLPSAKTAELITTHKPLALSKSQITDAQNSRQLPIDQSRPQKTAAASQEKLTPADQATGPLIAKIAKVDFPGMYGNQGDTYTLPLEIKLPNPVLAVAQGLLEEVITDDDQSLLPEEQWNRTIYFPELKDDMRTVEFAVEILNPKTEKTLINEIRGSLGYFTAQGSQELDTGLIDFNQGTEIQEIQVTIGTIQADENQPGWTAVQLQLDETHYEAILSATFFDSDDQQLQSRKSAWGSDGDVRFVTYSIEGDLPTSGRIVLEVAKNLVQHEISFKAENISLDGDSYE